MHQYFLHDYIKESKGKGKPLRLTFFRRDRFYRLVERIFSIISILTLLAPIFILSHVTVDTDMQRLMILASGALFALLVSGTTAAKRHELLAVTMM